MPYGINYEYDTRVWGENSKSASVDVDDWDFADDVVPTDPQMAKKAIIFWNL